MRYKLSFFDHLPFTPRSAGDKPCGTNHPFSITSPLLLARRAVTNKTAPSYFERTVIDDPRILRPLRGKSQYSRTRASLCHPLPSAAPHNHIQRPTSTRTHPQPPTATHTHRQPPTVTRDERAPPKHSHNLPQPPASTPYLLKRNVQ